ncbi:MAG: Vitamin B12 dependent methionine synthase activation subunit [Clostridia bacterium]|nr:Vitamin B12 dependent methionine synthase activation subunit [Clostridia bacterium]
MSVVTKTYQAPPFCEREILRYAGCKTANEETLSLLASCLEEVKEKLVYKVCYREFSLRISADICDFGAFRVRSTHLARNLAGCEKAIVFAATVGVEMDRLIAKYGRLAPSKALVMQAIGAERIEALCDAFCEDIKQEKRTALKPRFGAGYGDLPLDTQKQIVAVLDCPKRIGVCLNESMLMSPSKSVTAFLGLTHTVYATSAQKCVFCDKKDCGFRSEQ